MAIAKTILNYLEKNKYKYEIVEHKTAYTAWDKSQTEKVKPQEIAKTLALRVDNGYALALVPSNRNLDKKKLLKIINASRKKASIKNAKKIDFAKEAWMKKNIPGKVGAVPPFQGLVKLEIYLDNLLAKNKKIQVGSGEYTASILVSVKEFLEKEGLVKGSFSQSKK
jgi:prolyl-tRNA editing enzyme YbaK/EbsC (Cys-tRNA(Pro) deacylase)